MALNEKKEREYLIDIIQKYLETSKELLLYIKARATNRKDKLTCAHSIEKIEEAKIRIREIKQMELLNYIFSMFVGSNYQAHAMVGSWIMSERIKEYDTEQGILELREIIEENRKKALEKQERLENNLKTIKVAKEQGKKVEMVWDNDTKTIKPVVVEEKVNA